jgi:acetoin utilization deacetylase AcuC-like enzyme
MRLSLPIVWSDRHRLHEPGGEVWVGVRTPGTEVARRAEAIRDALAACDARFVDAEPHCDTDVLAVHDAALLDYLRGAWDAWTAAGLPDDPGQDRVVAYVFAHRGLTPHEPPAVPVATWARPGYFAYDTMTLVGPGTYEAARGAVDAALTAADLVADGSLGPVAYACCRPPGHHVTRTAHGGSCYLNDAAAAPPASQQEPAEAAPSPSSTSTPTAATGRGRSSPTVPTSSPDRCTSTRAPGGSPTSSGSPTSTGPGPAPA